MSVRGPGGSADVWSTSAVASERAFEYWQDLICDTFVQLSASPTTPRLFRGQITHSTYPAFEVSTVRAGGQRVRRTRQLIARANEEFMLASIQIRGRGRVEQGGRVAVLEPGAMAFYDSTHPYTLHFDDDFEQIVVQVPRQAVISASGAGSRAAQATAVPLSRHGAAGVIGSFFRSLSLAEQQDPVGAAVLSSHAGGLMASALSLACGLAPSSEAAGALQREQVLGYLRLRYADPLLDVDAVAQGCHMSRRTLFRLFEGAEVGVGPALRQIRVERAQRMLREQPGRAVSAVGQACGFRGEAQFHRAFRDNTGCTPAEYRQPSAGGTSGQ